MPHVMFFKLHMAQYVFHGYISGNSSLVNGIGQASKEMCTWGKRGRKEVPAFMYSAHCWNNTSILSLCKLIKFSLLTTG